MLCTKTVGLHCILFCDKLKTVHDHSRGEFKIEKVFVLDFNGFIRQKEDLLG